MFLYSATVLLNIVNRALYKTRRIRVNTPSCRQLSMSLTPDIISVLPALEDCREISLNSSSDLLPIPPAPPLPIGGFAKPWNDRRQDADSGCGSLGEDSYFDDLPGCNVTDSEFRESFAVSQTSSRRSSSSHGLTILLNVDDETIPAARIIPEPPPPPPLQFFIPRLVPAPDFLLRRDLSFDSDVSSLFASIRRLDGRIGKKSDFQTSSGICIVCFEAGADFLRLECCKKIVCPACLETTISTRLNDGLIEFPCPNPDCSEPIPRSEVFNHLSAEEKERFERLRVNAESDGKRKTCPHCSHITEHKVQRLRRRFREEDVKIVCENCRIEWCFQCHAPWHRDMTCKTFMRGNKTFQKWTKGRLNGTANCQKCPTCRVFIQRSTGCDHMTCNRCSTHFCYKCGGRFIEIPGLGDHYQQTSIFGCKFNYFAEQPAKRRALRGGYFGAKMAGLTGYPILFVAGVVVVVAVGVVALPVYGTYRLYKFKKNTSRMRRH